MSVDTKSETGYVSVEEFHYILDTIKNNSADEAHKILFDKVSKIVTVKCRLYISNNMDLEDLISDVYTRVFIKLPLMKRDPIAFFSKHGQIVENDLGRCFFNYVHKIATNILRTEYGIEIDTPIESFDNGERGEFLKNFIKDSTNIEEDLIKKEYIIRIYQLCLKVIFKINSKPYIILGYCFNRLLFGALKSDHAERGCSSYTAKKIADKMLGRLRDEFYDYHKNHLAPIPDKIIMPFDKKLADEYEGKAYRLHIMRTFYGEKPEKSISDWTENVKNSLFEDLLKEPELAEYRKERKNSYAG